MKNEHRCENSYGHKICVDSKIKYVACANYSKLLCDDYSTTIYDYEAKIRYPYHRCFITVTCHLGTHFEPAVRTQEILIFN